MQRLDSRRAGEDLANKLGVDDDQEVETLAGDEMFAAWAYIHQQADLYATEVEKTLAGDTMKQMANGAAENAREVATIRAEELLGRKLEPGECQG
jgi:hypothetical protein